VAENVKTPANLKANVRPTDGYVLAVDDKWKQRYETSKEALVAGEILKEKFPVAQIAVYDAGTAEFGVGFASSVRSVTRLPLLRVDFEFFSNSADNSRNSRAARISMVSREMRRMRFATTSHVFSSATSVSRHNCHDPFFRDNAFALTSGR
jgi:hypothetical protein